MKKIYLILFLSISIPSISQKKVEIESVERIIEFYDLEDPSNRREN